LTCRLEKRLAARQERSAALVAALEAWMRAERAKLSRHAAVAKAMDYMLTRWEAFTRFLDDGRICLTNNAAERALRLARRRPRPHRRHAADEARRSPSVELARPIPPPKSRLTAAFAGGLPCNWRTVS
jgi:hypothetical protein